MKINRILFFKLGAIGDTLMTTPLVRQVRKNFPEAKIDYLIGQSSAEILIGNKNINEVIHFNEKIFVKKRIRGLLKIIKKIRDRKYDLIFVLDKHWIFRLVSILARVPIRVGFNRRGKGGIFLTHKVYYGEIKHEIYCYLDLAKVLGLQVDYKNDRMELSLSLEEINFAKKIWKENKIKKTIALAPGGSKNYADKNIIRRAPPEVFIELLRRFPKEFTLILIGNNVDKNDFEKYLLKVDLDNRHILSLMGKCNLKESIAIMHKADIIICNDSGPMHMAATVNKKIISLFGPTHPLRKAPLWKESKFIWKAQHLYDINAENYGKYQNKEYFKGLKVEDILREIRTIH